MSIDRGMPLSLRLIADDLTGALDSSAPFATADHPVVVGLHADDLPMAPRLAMSTESRDLSESAAIETVASAFGALSRQERPRALWFKKIDSVLRGQPFAEALALAKAGGFSRMVVAPAYPAMGRRTIDGRQYVDGGDGGEARQVGPALRDGFSRLDSSLTLHASDEKPGVAAGSGLEIHMLDADTQADLDRRLQPFRAAAEKTLFVGAGGMAIALAGAPRRIAHPSPVLIVAGTRHPSTLAQLLHLRAHLPLVSPPEIVAPSLTAATPADTQIQIVEAAAHLGEAPDAGPIMIIGGDTLSAFLRGVEARSLECLGEACAGVPISRLRGGPADGRLLLTKSGGFGHPDLLTRIASGNPSDL
jgi:uncharacterized protein YgbK (DUF1537 family)